ncbi:hypothetical protein GCM10007920_46700 [Ciceribacter naphthalenivorans]|uniref:DUF2336 domain-containing protein n=3 Tax=Pseudomonadota TaxID=1224 RepID=A0A512HFW6_9HYPH|nr:hypothetical protein RNA01_12710 [Ciceribacter naphthalenivorans]GLR24876.1 hypothetical protein GCM10007920_46700 [Ciceribacter naphthalenivorans]GLT07732.1 hypothetical protein GCM10007926_46700 [Sphingomonas psychrolutea]
MATVTSFEALPFPGKSELRQFAELFTPLYKASSEEARRQAVAALSQCPNVPGAVALFIASQPISIAAPFLVASPCLTDDLLIMIARTQGGAHARAIVRRADLSPTVIDALVGLRHSEPKRTAPRAENMEAETETKSSAAVAPAKAEPVATRVAKRLIGGWKTTKTAKPATPASAPAASSVAATSPVAETDAARPGLDAAEREEQLRDQIRQLTIHMNRPSADRLGLRTITPIQAALLVRFARTREGGAFATTLADTLSSSRWLAERILLDLSGHQLATTLIGIGMEPDDALYVLERLYPHLGQRLPAATRAAHLWNSLDPVECEARIETWRRADSYTFRPQEAAPPQPADTPAAGAPAARSAPGLSLVSNDQSRQGLRQRAG